jgi:Cupin-like domain
MLVISIFIFCIVLFLYLHIHFHLKRSNDLEVYEIEQPSKQRLEEVCDIRQPTTFEFYNDQLLTQLSYQAIHTSYRAFDIHVRDVSKLPSSQALEDKTKIQQKGTEHDPVLYIPVTFKIAHEVLKKDTEMKYFSEHNADFIDETGLIKIFQLNDEFLRPYMVSTCMYDILMASIGTTTPLRYEVNYRNYFLVTQGRVKIQLIPPKDTRYLYPINDYDILEFRTPVNPWKVQPEYQDDFDKIKTLEVELFQGMVMFIPAYWWYSIQFVVHETSVCSFKYRTHMNTISIAPQLFMNVLQNMNTKRDTLEKRAFIKDQFQETTLVGNSGDASVSMSASSSSSASAPTSVVPEYSPSIDDQYLPKSLRGTSSNPYSIMNAMTENVSNTIQSAHTENTNVAAADAAAIPTELETSIISASSTTAAAASEYISTQKEVMITPEIGTKNTE